MNDLPTLHGPSAAAQSGQTKKLVILLHGVGSNGDDLYGLVPELAPTLQDTAFVSPNAPFPCDMAPFGYQWFSLQNRADEALRTGVEQVAPILNQFIDTQMQAYGVEAKDTALVGFSQGTMTSLFTGLRRKEALAGIVGFSGAMISAAKLPKEILCKTPVCLVHGQMDEVVPFAAMDIAKRALVAADVEVEAHARPNLGHSIDREGLDAAIAFLKKKLS